MKYGLLLKQIRKARLPWKPKTTNTTPINTTATTSGIPDSDSPKAKAGILPTTTPNFLPHLSIIVHNMQTMQIHCGSTRPVLLMRKLHLQCLCPWAWGPKVWPVPSAVYSCIVNQWILLQDPIRAIVPLPKVPNDNLVWNERLTFQKLVRREGTSANHQMHVIRLQKRWLLGHEFSYHALEDHLRIYSGQMHTLCQWMSALWASQPQLPKKNSTKVRTRLRHWRKHCRDRWEPLEEILYKRKRRTHSSVSQKCSPRHV